MSTHGDKDQEERNKAVQEFKSFVKDVLVATDVASKGLGKCILPKKIREITFHNKKNLTKKLFFTQIFLKSNMLSTMICRMILKITYIGLDVRVVEMPKVLHFSVIMVYIFYKT